MGDVRALPGLARCVHDRIRVSCQRRVGRPLRRSRCPRLRAAASPAAVRSVWPRRLRLASWSATGCSGIRELAEVPTTGFHGEHDPRTGERIRTRVMVPERNVQTTADIRQPGARPGPPPVRQFHGTDEALARRTKTVASAAGVEHPPVELGVVSGNEPCRGEPLPQRRPQFAESGRLAHILPTQTMHPREREPPSGRTDQVAPRLHHMATAAGRESDRAGTVVAGVGDLEVDGHEGVVRGDYHARFDGSGGRNEPGCRDSASRRRREWWFVK